MPIRIPIISKKIEKLIEKYSVDCNTLKFIEDPENAKPLVEIHINPQAEILNGDEVYAQVKKFSEIQEKQLEEVARHPQDCSCGFCIKMRERNERLKKQEEEEEARIAAEEKARNTPKAKMARMVKEAGNKAEKMAQSCKDGVCKLKKKKEPEPPKSPHHYHKGCDCGALKCGAAVNKKGNQKKGGLEVVYTPRKKENAPCCVCAPKKPLFKSMLSEF